MYNYKNYLCFSISELLRKYSKEELQTKFNAFSCQKNKEIELFIKNNSISFSLKHQSVSYIIFDTTVNRVVAYFALSIKPIRFDITTLSNTALKRLERISEVDLIDNTITPSAYLIAQLGKSDDAQIDINDIFYFLDNNIIDIQNACGGVVEFLESENNDKLIALYQNRGFKIFNIRKSKSGEERKLVQMYRLI
ncbi:MAG: hypothetical protein IJP71_03890 [Lachnospiraceae bacterium]|nr:hypothetical protein [Lachnospiraceae bacterium]